MLVMKNCFRCGLYWQGLTHDLSKLAPVEFWAGAKYWQGTCSPNNAQRQKEGYSAAWLHHKGRNKHHFEYWFDNGIGVFELVPVEMPLKYIKEMFCDRVAASKVYYGDKYDDTVPLQYFNRMDYTKLMAPKTNALLKELLEMLAEQGEDATFAYIRTLK